MYDEPEIDPRVSSYAEEHGVNPFDLDWHLEAIHGWERHDEGYSDAVQGFRRMR